MKDGAVMRLGLFAAADVTKQKAFDVGTPFLNGELSSRALRIGVAIVGGVWSADAQRYRFA